MKHVANLGAVIVLVVAMAVSPCANGYVADTTAQQGGGCPVFDRWNLSLASPLNRRWSTSLPLAPSTILTVATQGTSAQTSEIAKTISDSFGAWSGVSGTTFNESTFPGSFGPLAQVSVANSCSNDAENNVDGLNTICFNQSSMGFASGVLAFTRVITANAPGVSVGASGPAAFAGQILDADTLFRNDGQETFATPAALATSAGQGANDLESILTHELGHWLGLDHSGVWRAMMFPFAPTPGQFLGNRPTAQAPDGPLADDDRTGIRSLYPDSNDTVHVGAIRGRIIPANPFALATFPPPSAGTSVTGMFGVQVVAVDANTGGVIAAALAGWSCGSSNSTPHFDGSYDIERLPVGRSYLIYAEPLVGLAVPADFSVALNDLCASSSPACTTPGVNTEFNPRARPTSP
jgi:matrixin